MSEEAWIVCADCGVCLREADAQDGFCFWCTPEGKAEAERFRQKLFDALVKAGADIVPLQEHERVNR